MAFDRERDTSTGRGLAVQTTHNGRRVVTLEQLFVRVRRRENRFYDAIYRIVKACQRFRIPVIRPLHRALYYERRARMTAWRNVVRVCYVEPLFKARCESFGANVRVDGEMPYVMGDLRIHLGTGTWFCGRCTLAGTTMARGPILEIGDHTTIGYGVTISVGARVSIGKHVLIGNGVFIAGADGHPIDAQRRRTDPGNPDGVVVIEDDAWVGQAAIVLKDVRIGRGAIVGTGAVVSKDVAPYTVVAGNPARVVKELSARS